jgi:hypothetical protein
MRKTINARELRRMYDLDGAKKTVNRLSEALDKEQLKAEDFSIRDLAEGLVPDGREWVRSMDPRSGVSILESSDAVDSTAFSNITGQLIINRVMESFQSEQFVLSGLVNTIATRLNGEKIPGLTPLHQTAPGTEGLDSPIAVHEGMPYPAFGFGEDYVETPSTTKHGLIVPVTKEAIFFDRTGLIMDRASQVGEILGLDKEKRLLNCLVGYTNNFKWKGTTYDTYSVDGSTGDEGGTALSGVINSLASNELVDWTDVDNAEQLFANMLDPTTGEPIIMGAPQVLVCPAYRHAAARVFNATSIEYTASSAPTKTIAASPISGYTWYESRLMYRRIIATVEATASKAAAWWFMGDFRKALAYMENWPVTVVQAPNNSEAEFLQDIVLRFKASERGAAAVLQPRAVVKCYNT